MYLAAEDSNFFCEQNMEPERIALQQRDGNIAAPIPLEYPGPRTKQQDILGPDFNDRSQNENQEQMKIFNQFTRYIQTVCHVLSRMNRWVDPTIAQDEPVNPNRWIRLNEKYTDIEETIVRCFESNLNTCILLTGCKGRGRSSALYYAMSKIQQKEQDTAANQRSNEKLAFIEFDASLHEIDKSTLMNYLVNKLEDLSIKSDVSIARFSGNYHERFISMLKHFRVIIYIKNVDIYTETTRQVFLYTFLDNINQYAMKVALIFSTSDVFFLNKLEKRVRSRFSYKEVCFDDLDAQQVVIPVLLDKVSLSQKDSETSIQDPPLKITRIKRNVETLQKVLAQDQKIREILERCILIGQGLHIILDIFKTALMLSNHSHLLTALNSGEVIAGEYLYKKMLEARSLLNFEGGDAEILNSLSKQSKLAIFVLSNATSQRKNSSNSEVSNRKAITYMEYRSKIVQTSALKVDTMNRGWWRTMPPAILKDGLITLHKLGYVHLSKTPIDNETHIHLAEHLTPLYISTTFAENDFKFA
jgi:hypothetical protein